VGTEPWAVDKGGGQVAGERMKCQRMQVRGLACLNHCAIRGLSIDSLSNYSCISHPRK
jgi:hypothetical protein